MKTCLIRPCSSLIVAAHVRPLRQKHQEKYHQLTKSHHFLFPHELTCEVVASQSAPLAAQVTPLSGCQARRHQLGHLGPTSTFSFCFLYLQLIKCSSTALRTGVLRLYAYSPIAERSPLQRITMHKEPSDTRTRQKRDSIDHLYFLFSASP